MDQEDQEAFKDLGLMEVNSIIILFKFHLLLVFTSRGDEFQTLKIRRNLGIKRERFWAEFEIFDLGGRK